MGVDIAKSV